MSYYHGWPRYVPVSERRAKAKKRMEKLQKTGKTLSPIKVSGRQIATTFWGSSWCEHLEKFSDYENRLPRGRTYLRNGSVCHLEINSGKIEALVSGSSLYKVNINIKPLAEKQWQDIQRKCAGQVSSILELLQGKFSNAVMKVVSDPQHGLFPQQKEMSFDCSCPDWAFMCKHIAAVLYGVGAKLDTQPELLFLLRNVDHRELIDGNIQFSNDNEGTDRRLVQGELSDIFGIEIETPITPKKVEANTETTEATNNIEITTQESTLIKMGKESIKTLPILTLMKFKKAPKAPKAPKKIKTIPKKSQKISKPKASPITPIASIKPVKSVSPIKEPVYKKQEMNVITGRTLIELRNRFEMNKSQFARLIEATPALVTAWEKKTTALSLQEEVQASVSLLLNANKKQAWNILDAIS